MFAMKVSIWNLDILTKYKNWPLAESISDIRHNPNLPTINIFSLSLFLFQITTVQTEMLFPFTTFPQEHLELKMVNPFTSEYQICGITHVFFLLSRKIKRKKKKRNFWREKKSFLTKIMFTQSISERKWKDKWEFPLPQNFNAIHTGYLSLSLLPLVLPQKRDVYPYWCKIS